MIKHHFPSGNRAKHNKKALLTLFFTLQKQGVSGVGCQAIFRHGKQCIPSYRRAKAKGIWEQINHDLVKKCRLKIGRKPDATFLLLLIAKVSKQPIVQKSVA